MMTPTYLLFHLPAHIPPKTHSKATMALKRQREKGSPLNVKSWISSFGEAEIHDISKEGNASFARGAFGELSISIRRSAGDDRWQFVAIKTMERALISSGPFGRGKQQLSRDVFNELLALRYLNPHPNIVPLLAVYPAKESHLSRTSLSLAFPYSPVDLYLSLEWRRRTGLLPLLSFGVIKTIARDIFAALAHCHSFGVLHRDVKPGNLLVSSSGVIQLCDFGLGKPFVDENNTTVKPSKGESGTKGLCTLYYRPPEVLLGAPAADPAIDMYSAGTVIAELLIGQPLFPGENVLDQLSLVFELLGTPTESSFPTAKNLPDYGKLNFTPKSPKPWVEIVPRVLECLNLPEFLSQLVALDPQRRLTSQQALDHKWLVSKPQLARYRQLRNELIPPKLREPLLLAPEDISVASRLAIKLAAKRRTFLNTDAVSWHGPSMSSKRLSDVCSEYRKYNSSSNADMFGYK